MKFTLGFRVEDKKRELIIDDNFENEELKVLFIKGENLIIKITPKTKLKIDSAYLTKNYDYKDSNRILLNGYQSWTDSKEVGISHKEKNFSKLIKPVINKYKFEQYGDYTFYNCKSKSGEMHSFTYSYIRENNKVYFIGSLSEKNGYTIIEHSVEAKQIKIIKECEGLEINDNYEIFNLLETEGSDEKTFHDYFQLMGMEKKKDEILRGWTSWYNYYEDITEEIIVENLNNFADKNINLDCFQIDDGYQNAVGDWLVINNKFPKGMKYLSDEIKSKGYDSGLWLAPFACEVDSILAKEHPEWILRDKNGEKVFGGSNWSGFYALDFYNPEVQEYLREVFDTVLNKWGYDIVKLDFLYAVCLIPRDDKTRGQIMCEAMEFLREICGDKKILACGVPLGPSFGLVDYCRIGCDVGLDWDDKFYMKAMHRERISSLNAMKNSIFRRQIDGYAFVNDPDVFLLRKSNISLSKQEKETLFWINHIFGSVIFTSDNIAEYGMEEWNLYKKSFEIKTRIVINIEDDNDLIITKVELNGENFTFAFNLSNKKRVYRDSVIEKHETIYFKEK